jgi:uncharacterized protein (DUF885 family)
MSAPEPGEGYAPDPSAEAADPAFARLARNVLDALLELDPVEATALGDHRLDDRLPDWSETGLAHARATVSSALSALDSVDESALSRQDVVDHELLRSALASRLFGLDDLRPQTWDPLLANPGTAIYLLLARDFAPLADRLRSAGHRLAAVPEYLAVARESLTASPPRVHTETALVQFRGTMGLLSGELVENLEREPAMVAEVEPARTAALEALEEHVRWLESRLPTADRDPRLGPELYAAKLWHTLDTGTPPDRVLVRAESDLMRIEAEIADLVGGRDVRAVYDEIADSGLVDDSTVLSLCQDALREATAFVRERDLVTVPANWDDLVEIIVMPEIHRGVAVAYCDPPGPLEQKPLPMFFAVSPTPADWPRDRVRSFYREYNAHLLRNLTVHEAMPGHVLQLAHSAQYVGSSPVRAALSSGVFVEGWAVFAEQLMVSEGFVGGVGAGGSGGAAVAQALRLQQLKMQLRSTINAILDVRVHAHQMTEPEAMALMTGRGHQEVGEAAGKWRRAQLTSAQLATYYVGYTEVADLARDLADSRPRGSARDRHDELLAHGSPPPRHLRYLLGLPEIRVPD